MLKQCRTGQEQTDRCERIFLAGLRDRLCVPVNAVIEYSEMLLDDAKKQGRDDLTSDLTKIHLSWGKTSGTR